VIPLEELTADDSLLPFDDSLSLLDDTVTAPSLLSIAALLFATVPAASLEAGSIEDEMFSVCVGSKAPETSSPEQAAMQSIKKQAAIP
jgi:hypothetical protein